MLLNPPCRSAKQSAQATSGASAAGTLQKGYGESSRSACPVPMPKDQAKATTAAKERRQLQRQPRKGYNGSQGKVTKLNVEIGQLGLVCGICYMITTYSSGAHPDETHWQVLADLVDFTNTKSTDHARASRITQLHWARTLSTTAGARRFITEDILTARSTISHHPPTPTATVARVRRARRAAVYHYSIW